MAGYMTWGEFKKWMEEHGAWDEDDIGIIDVHLWFTDESPSHFEQLRNGAGRDMKSA